MRVVASTHQQNVLLEAARAHGLARLAECAGVQEATAGRAATGAGVQSATLRCLLEAADALRRGDSATPSPVAPEAA